MMRWIVGSSLKLRFLVAVAAAAVAQVVVMVAMGHRAAAVPTTAGVVAAQGLATTVAPISARQHITGNVAQVA